MLKISIFLLSFSLIAQNLKVSGARIPKFDEKGKLESVVTCKTAVQKNGKVHMTGVELTLYDQSDTRMKTSKCRLLQIEKKITGKDKVFLKSKGMDLEGRGFVYDRESKILTIHNDVVIYLNYKEKEQK